MTAVLVLGPIEARVDGVPVPITSPTQRVLLAALAHARGRAVPITRLAALVWGDHPPASARNSLKSHISRLRRTLGGDVIEARPPGYALTVPADNLDVDRFEHGVRDARSVAEIDAALALWRGPPFGDLADHGHFAGEVTRLSELHAQARLRRAELLAATGAHDDAAAAYKELTAEDPLREPAWIGLLQTLHAAGRQADATDEARRYRDRVADVGLEPSPRFVDAEREVFTTPPPADQRAAAPVPVPARVSSIIGRQRELARIQELLSGRRLVTLVGPGGVGKTTVAVEAARSLADALSDGAWVARLADIDESASVVPAIARAVGAPTSEPLDRSLEYYLQGRRSLVILDSIEHVHTTARAVARRLVTVAQELRVLTTSRQPLDVAGEVVMPIEPLDRPDAMRLFRERARDAGVPISAAQEELAAAVCDQLDRLPLALEMAAGRLRGLGLDDLAARLDERLHLLRSAEQGRHETLGEVVAWSYDLLDPAQQALLAQLSVFAGPFDLQAAEAVSDVPGVAGNVADLVDRSLLHAVVDGGHAQYRLLETVRSFAAERLTASGAREPTLEGFVAHHVDVAERIARGLRGPDEVSWAETLHDQTANLEAAHARALELGDVDAAVRIAAAPYVAVYQRLRADIGAWAEATLPHARRAAHPATVAVAAIVALNRLNRGDADGARALLAELPEQPAARHAHEVLAELHVYHGELEAGLEHLRRAEELARVAEDHFTAMYARVSLAITLGYAGQVDDGLALVARLRREAVEAGNPLIAAWCDYTDGELLAETHQRRALMLVDRAVTEADRAGWRMLSGVSRLTASSLRARAGDPTDAVPGFERLIRHWDRLGDHTHQWTTLRNLVDLLIRLSAYEPAAQLLGAVSGAPTPTFGPEQRRLEEASVTVRAQLGDQAGALIQAGRDDDIAAAVNLGLSTLADLRAANEHRADATPSSIRRRSASQAGSG